MRAVLLGLYLAGCSDKAAPPAAGSATGSSAPVAPAAPAAKPPAPAPPPPPAMPGACVDPLPDASKRLADAGEGDPPAPSAAPDLDGDGQADVAFTFGMATTTNTLLYVKRGSCGHFVGDVGNLPKAGATRTRGLADLIVPETSACEGARCGCEPGEHHFVFDGTVYKLDDTRTKQSHEKPCKD